MRIVRHILEYCAEAEDEIIEAQLEDAISYALEGIGRFDNPNKTKYSLNWHDEEIDE